MRAVLFSLLFLFAAPQGVSAGPWPREAQRWFLSATTGLDRGGAGWLRFSDLYAEYGLTERVTMVAQMRRAANGWRGDLIARWHPPLSGFALPVGLGVGARLNPAGADRLHFLLFGHLGRGVDTRRGNLWTRLDLQVQTRPSQPARPVDLSLSAQVGFRSNHGVLGMLSLRQNHRNRTAIIELSPAIGIEVSQAHTLALSVTTSPAGRRVNSAQLSLWSRF